MLSRTASMLRSLAPRAVLYRCKSTGGSAKFAFVGAGKMAEAMIAPLKSQAILGAKPTIRFFDVSCKVADRMAAAHPCTTRALTLGECVEDADVIVLCCKPQNCASVFDELRPHVASRNPVLLSILAGVPMAKFVAGLGLPKIVRSMPNTPGQIGAGVTVWTKNADAAFTEDELELCRASLRAMGQEIFVEDESFLDMATSISGSGPAYVFLLIEAMVDAGVQEGFPREIATALVHQTILGSVQYAMASGEHPAVLKNSVTSPAGTTASAIYTLERGQFRTVVQDAIWACYRRSLEMGGHSSNVGPGRATGPSPKSEFPDALADAAAPPRA